jgi:glycosyltransferase involved in cell wall biosynthesis
MIKILMVISQFYPMIGGTEKQAQLLASTLVEKGIDVSIVTGRWSFKTPRREIVGRVKVFRNFSSLDWFRKKENRMTRLLGGLTYVASLAIYLLAHGRKYDLIHVHQVLHPAFTSVLVGKRLFKRPVLVKAACSGLTSDIRELMRYPFGSLQLRYLIKEMEYLVVVNQEGKAEFKAVGYPESRVAYIPNGVKIPSEGRNTYRRILHFLTIARLDRQKGIDVLLKAWDRILQVENNLKLTVLGSGSQELELKRLSESLKVDGSVEFRGTVQDIDQYFGDADLFVLPSRAEGLSNALLEAMSRGIPCVATNIGGNSELLGAEDKPIPAGRYSIGRNGILVNPDDVEGLAEAMGFLIQNSKVREEVGKGGRRYIQENHSIELIADKYIALYQRMLSERS